MTGFKNEGIHADRAVIRLALRPGFFCGDSPHVMTARDGDLLYHGAATEFRCHHATGFLRDIFIGHGKALVMNRALYLLRGNNDFTAPAVGDFCLAFGFITVNGHVAGHTAKLHQGARHFCAIAERVFPLGF